MALSPGTRRPKAPRGVVLACLIVLSSGCSDSSSEAPATWTVRAGHQVGPETTSFTALVSRLGCNNGVTGDVHEPDVSAEDEVVVVTFSVDPIETDASCPDNDEVPYEVVLPEPLGDRSLVDGQCESDTDASRTALCEPDGVRYSPS
jgi:hypothetical protein